MKPKTHFIGCVVSGFAAFFAASFALFSYLPPGQIKIMLMPILSPGAAWATMFLAWKIIPAKCPQCGAGAYRERGAEVRYACRSCNHVADLGFKLVPGRIDD
jgi:hypothetical protein